MSWLLILTISFVTILYYFKQNRLLSLCISKIATVFLNLMPQRMFFLFRREERHLFKHRYLLNKFRRDGETLIKIDINY